MYYKNSIYNLSNLYYNDYMCKYNNLENLNLSKKTKPWLLEISNNLEETVKIYLFGQNCSKQPTYKHQSYFPEICYEFKLPPAESIELEIPNNLENPSIIMKNQSHFFVYRLTLHEKKITTFLLFSLADYILDKNKDKKLLYEILFYVTKFGHWPKNKSLKRKRRKFI